MDMRGMPPTKAFVHQMAELLLAERLTDLRIGKCWVNNFLKRHPELKSKYNRKYDYVKTATEVGVRAIQDHKVIEWNTCWKCRLSEGTDDM